MTKSSIATMELSDGDNGNRWLAIKAAAEIVKAGGVVAYPTESCFGLGCDPGNIEAVKRILAMKKRRREMGLIVIADRWARLKPWLEPLPDETVERIQQSWPGPVSWLCPKSSRASAWITGDHQSLGVRVPDHPVALRLCRDAGSAIVSTSANVSGSPALRSAKAVRRVFGDLVDVVLDFPVGGSDKPSTIIDAITGKVLRS